MTRLVNRRRSAKKSLRKKICVKVSNIQREITEKQE